MLFDLLRQTTDRINQLDPMRDGPTMIRQVDLARPDFDESLRRGTTKNEVEESVYQTMKGLIGAGMVATIKQIPIIVETMLDRVRGQGADSALRCAVVGALAYLVQPHDIIPDNAPGGYGFVDDDVILRVAHIEFLNVLPPSAGEAERARDYYQMSASMVPLKAIPALQNAVNGVSIAFQVFRQLPPDLLEFTTQQTIANPIQMTTPNPPPGFTHSTPPTFDTGRWSGGVYFEGNDVIVPGGPSLIDGKLFIPS